MTEILAHPSNFTPGRQRGIDRIVVHYTAGDGDTAQNNGMYFSAADRNASAHYFVDEGEILLSVREEDTAHHAGTWEMNSRSVGVEMCSKKDGAGRYYIPEKTVVLTQSLVRQLMEKYKIPITGVLRHYDVTGKSCPAPMVENEALWQAFLRGLKEDAPSPWAEEACRWAVEQNLFLGDGAGRFHWQQPVTREQLAAVLYRFKTD